MSIQNNSIINKINSITSNILKDHNKKTDQLIPIYNPNVSSKKIIVLSGGGIKGISFIGALQFLHEYNILSNIHTFAGTSVGSLILFLIIIGYSPNDLYELIKVLDLNKLKKVSVSLFLESFGLDSGDGIIKTMIKLLHSKNMKHDITFNELFKLTNKTFIVSSVNVNEQKVKYLSHLTYPNMPVIQAVRMSISIPFVFTPVLFEKCLYVDGGCIDNFPISLFLDKKDELIGICVNDTSLKSDIKSIYDYAINVIYCVLNGITDTIVKIHEKYVININIENTNAIEFDISLNTKKYLYETGYNATLKYFS